MNKRTKEFFDRLIIISKISIIAFVFILTAGTFFPFYEYPNDSHVYGFQTIQIANGKYEYTNDFLQNSEDWQFVPGGLVKTQYNTAIPNILPLFPLLASGIYKLFGNIGLFYFNPILTLVFLIIIERTTTKIFNKYIGLLVLIFISVNEMTFWVGRGFLTSIIFSMFFILGVYFLNKFLKYKSNNFIIYSSVFFTLSCFIRPNGIIFVPIELTIILSWYFYEDFVQRKLKNTSKIDCLIKRCKTLCFTITPWLVFVMFMIFFNTYYFGNPTTTFYNIPDSPEKFTSEIDSNGLLINYDRFEKYAGHFMPYPLNRVAASLNYGEVTADQQFNEIMGILGNYEILSHLGMIIFILISIGLVISLKNKEYARILIIYTIFMLSMIIFYSFNFIADGRQGSPRDMLPVYPIFFTIISFIIYSTLTIKNYPKKTWIRFIPRTFKIGTISFLIIFIPVSFLISDFSSTLKDSEFSFNDPFSLSDEFNDFDKTLPQDSIIVTFFEFDRVIFSEYIPFTPLGWDNKDFDPNDEIFQKTINKLKTLLEKDNQEIFVYKKTNLQHEKDFQKYITQNENFKLIDYSRDFCKLILDYNNKIKNDDKCY